MKSALMNDHYVLADPDDPYKLLDEMRSMGLVVARGPSVMLICPMDGDFCLFH